MKRSLHIGINDYPGTGMDLQGCINDANDWREELESRGFTAASLLNREASKSAMVEAISRLVAETGRDDIGVITYSGHGTWVPDEDADEADGRDEALCPHDTTQGNILKDDELYAILCERKAGARIIVISDSCHSGTVAKACRAIPGTELDPWKFQKVRFLAPEFYIGDNPSRLRRARAVEHIKAAGKIRAAAVLFSGCKDDEYSYDGWFNKRPNGAFTYAALQALKELPKSATYRDWYRQTRTLLPHVTYPQTPQLSGTWQQRATWRIFEP